MSRFGVEARYRFVSQDPVEAPSDGAAVRVAVKRDVTARERVRAELDLVAVATESGRFHALIDLGDDRAVRPRRSALRGPARAPASASRSPAICGSASRAFAELSADDERESWAVRRARTWRGRHGRFWLSGAFGIGIYQIDTAPRFLWGIVF